MIGVAEQSKAMGFSTSAESSTFGVCTPMPANANAASFMYNDILDNAPQLYMETRCIGSNPKFSVYSDSSCSSSR